MNVNAVSIKHALRIDEKNNYGKLCAGLSNGNDRRVTYVPPETSNCVNNYCSALNKHNILFFRTQNNV